MSKFLDAKSLIEDLNDMMVELRENDIFIAIEPQNDIQIKMLSIGRTDMLSIYFRDLVDKEKYYNLIYDKISFIKDYMQSKGYLTQILLKPVPKTTRAMYKGHYERYGLNISIEELKDFTNRKLEWIQLQFKNMSELNESLPNKKTVDQLKMVAKLSKKTDIGNRLPDENGSNMRYIRNPIDNIESFEDYEKKNKNYIPSWNLKHLLSPFKGETKIKRVTESYENMIEFDDNKYTIVYGEDIISDTDYGVYSSYDNDKKYLVAKKDVEKLDTDDFTFDGLAVTNEYYALAKKAKDKYEQVKSDADSIRYSDEQYEDPSEWYAFEEYSKYYRKGRWSNIFWDFIL